jgi:hypothetical protein
MKSGVQPHEIAIFVRSPAELDRAKAAAREAALSFVILDNNVETTAGRLSISTMHLAKGLEFRAVAAMACDDEVIPLQERIDPRRWNEACDYAINPLLLDAGLGLPDGVLVDPRFRGMSAEQIYNLREAEAQPQPGGQNSASDGAGAGSGETSENQRRTDEPTAPEMEGGIGQVLDAPLPDEETPTAEEQAREWSVPGNIRQGWAGPKNCQGQCRALRITPHAADSE